MSPDIWAAIISGGAAVVVALLSAGASYFLGRRNSRAEFENSLVLLKEEFDGRLTGITATGAQDRTTAQREYQLEAMKTFRAAVGGPKGQIIEAVHDLADRLSKFLSKEQDWTWTNAQGGYYRTSFTWLLVRPFVWMEILRQRMVYLDQTLGDLIEEEHRFLRYCGILERTLTDAALFQGTGYDRLYASAHVFSGTVRALSEALGTRRNAEVVCMGYQEFEVDVAEQGISRAREVEAIITDLGIASPLRDFRIARLVAVYCGANLLLEDFALPYRQVGKVSDSLRYLDLVGDKIREPVRGNLDELLKEMAARRF